MAKVVSVGTTVFVIMITLMFFTVGQVLIQTERAQTVTDFSALAAADALRGIIDEDPCTVAQKVLELNNTTMHSCQIQGLTVKVTARITVVGQNVGIVARAGPPV